MRAPFVTCEALGRPVTVGAPAVPWLRHNFGVERATYTHEALDVFVPIGSVLRAPGDGVLTDFNPQDTGAGGYWVKYTEDQGTAWYFAHNERPPGYARGTRFCAGCPITTTGWTGNAGRGNATVAGRRTEPHVHAAAKVRVNGVWYVCDPWPQLCALWGFDPRPYKHDSVVLPLVIVPTDMPLTPHRATSAPGSGASRGGGTPRGLWRRLLDLIDQGVVLPGEMETAWDW